MIPELVDIGAPWKVLPPGIHFATIDEIRRRFAINARRKKMFEGFEKGVEALKKAGCVEIYLDGSYVTEKENPGDFDACWSTTGVDPHLLDPTLLDFDEARKNQKDKFGGEFFPASFDADASSTYLDFLQNDRHTGKKKGIIKIDTTDEEKGTTSK